MRNSMSTKRIYTHALCALLLCVPLQTGLSAQETESYDLARSGDSFTAVRFVPATRGDRQEEAVVAFRSLSTSDDPEIGAVALEAWHALRRRQGRAGDARTLRRWLVERYPGSAQAAAHVFRIGDAAHDRGDLEGALEAYGRLQEMAPVLNAAGLARMRMAQIHLGRGDSTRALGHLRTYLESFPDGRRWEEATYWAGRILRGSGAEEEGTALLRAIAEGEPLSYYAVLAAEELALPYRLPGTAGDDLPPAPRWLELELGVLDALSDAGLDEGRGALAERLAERALEDSHRVALRLAHELIERDLTLAGINLGWDLRERGVPWSRSLLEATYPLPRREMLVRAARDRGLDPILVASVIRQESAFDPRIVSRAGAVGLMQVMPATGRQLAAAAGPRDFGVESLVTPEINLHLGTLYLRDLWRRYDGDLNLVLSAYNAGPTRADAWKRFPEASDSPRFVERIPFAETRDYVKRVRRNMALYGALYGDGTTP
jgi:soluble lytic murein transglycosylase